MRSEVRILGSVFRIRSSGVDALSCVPETRNSKLETRNSKRSPEVGFTLIELTVVLFILAMATALVGPGLKRSFGQLQLRAAARDVAALCRFARTQAISHQGVLEVVLDRRVNSYWLQGPDWIVGRLGGLEQVGPAESPEQPWQAGLRQARVRPLPAGVSLKSVVLDTGALHDDERGAIAFFPQGSSTGGEVWISDERGRGYQIVVDPAIGLVRVQAAAAA